MYDRRYGGRELRFEASGGLVNSALIMRDRETDSYWSIMEGGATAGPLRGTRLVALPGSAKLRFVDWVARHPETRVLSVGGREHAPDVYADYWAEPRGFRGQRASDARLPTKAAIFSFERAGRRYAVEHGRVEGGYAAHLGDDGFVFFHRPRASALFESTRAFRSRAGFVRDAGRWIEVESGARFDSGSGRFRGGKVPALHGIDTYWYTWSRSNPTAELLR